MAKFLGIPGDLSWDYIKAGEYETPFFCNGYRYRIEKREYSYGRPEWIVYYKWWYARAKPWKELRRYSRVHQTLKQAKQAAASHNLRPRAKFKFVGRVPESPSQNGYQSYADQRNVGKLKFNEVQRDGTIYPYSPRYLDPESIYAPISYIGDKLEQQEKEALSKVFLKVPEGLNG